LARLLQLSRSTLTWRYAQWPYANAEEALNLCHSAVILGFRRA
jgi:hypothetical protein